jgi:hypothetical protein
MESTLRETCVQILEYYGYTPTIKTASDKEVEMNLPLASGERLKVVVTRNTCQIFTAGHNHGGTYRPKGDPMRYETPVELRDVLKHIYRRGILSNMLSRCERVANNVRFLEAVVYVKHPSRDVFFCFNVDQFWTCAGTDPFHLGANITDYTDWNINSELEIQLGHFLANRLGDQIELWTAINKLASIVASHMKQ